MAVQRYNCHGRATVRDKNGQFQHVTVCAYLLFTVCASDTKFDAKSLLPY